MTLKQATFTVKEGFSYLPIVVKIFGDDATLLDPVQISGRSENEPAILQVVVSYYEEKLPQNSLMKQKGFDIEQFMEFEQNKYFKSKAPAKTFSRQGAKLNINHNAIKAYEEQQKKEKIFDENILFAEQKYLLKSDASENLSKKRQVDENTKLLKKLEQQVDYLMHMRWGELSPMHKDLAIPPEFAKIFEQATKSDMLQKHINEIMRATLKNMPEIMRSNSLAISRYFRSLLKSMIPCRVDAPIRKSRVMMLVGPTGVGKTTTLAKLAHRYAYGQRRYNVAIISLDDFRLGAKEQIADYAGLLKIPIHFVRCEEKLKASLDAFSGYDLILIDSTGNSHFDLERISKLERYLNVSTTDIEVNLVLNASMKYADMLAAFKAFDVLKIETLILTKFDETSAFGNVFSLIFDVKRPVSFISTGQTVPDDILPASSDFLIDCVLDGFKKGE